MKLSDTGFSLVYFLTGGFSYRMANWTTEAIDIMPSKMSTLHEKY